jgi:hypothetical protein
MRSRVATAVNQAKRLSQRADDVDLCATFVRFDYSPLGLGEVGGAAGLFSGWAVGFSAFGAVSGGADNSARSFNQS